MSRNRLVLPSFAKVNLTLELLGRRADRYWEIRTVYQTISLHDRITLRMVPRGRVTVRVPQGGAPSGRLNLVHGCLSRARRRLGLNAGIDVELGKTIPFAAGLGGGSSNAAVALLGLLQLTGTRLSRTELIEWGASVGADVPFFFLGGRVLGVGRGEEVYPLDDLPPLWCVVICPPSPVSTRTAYQWATRGRRRLTLRPRASKITRLRSGRNAPWAGRNDFEAVVFPQIPELARMKTALLAAGASWAGLSGSGSAVYGLFPRRASAERAAAKLAGEGAVFLSQTLPRSVYRRAVGLSRSGEGS